MHKLNKDEIPILILAGGLGTRLAEETSLRPKPMVEIGGRPILWHIMRYYSHFGFRNFVVCAGYMSSAIKEFFSKLSWFDQSVDFHFSHSSGDHSISSMSLIDPHSDYTGWRVRVIETGADAMTGARVSRALKAIDIRTHDIFGLTYGDGLCDVDLDAELSFHMEAGKIGTVLGVHPVARFGVLDADKSGLVRSFAEKPQTTSDFINGGFFFMTGAFQKYLSDDDSCILEKKPLENLARDQQLTMYKHEGFWHCMDTLRDKQFLQSMWDAEQCSWRLWK